MKRLVLFGNTNFTRLIKFYVENDAKRVVECVVVDDDFITEDIFGGVPVISFEKFIKKYDKTQYEVLICIGYSQMNTIRQSVFNKIKKYGFGIASFIHSSAIIAKNVVLGEGCIILENVTIQPFCELGNSNLIWHSANIAHNSIIGNYNTIASNASLNGFTTVANNCFIGSGSITKDHINVDDFTLLGAGAFLSNDTERYDVYVPEKSVKIGYKSTDIKL